MRSRRSGDSKRCAVVGDGPAMRKLQRKRREKEAQGLAKGWPAISCATAGAAHQQSHKIRQKTTHRQGNKISKSARDSPDNSPCNAAVCRALKSRDLDAALQALAQALREREPVEEKTVAALLLFAATTGSFHCVTELFKSMGSSSPTTPLTIAVLISALESLNFCLCVEQQETVIAKLFSNDAMSLLPLGIVAGRYFQTCVRLLLMETLGETAQCLERSCSSSLERLVSRGLALGSIRVCECGADQRKLVLGIGSQRITGGVRSIRRGDLVMLSPDRPRSPFAIYPRIEATVDSMLDDGVMKVTSKENVQRVLDRHNQACQSAKDSPSLPASIRDLRWRLDKLCNHVSYSRVLRALGRFNSASSQVFGDSKQDSLNISSDLRAVIESACLPQDHAHLVDNDTRDFLISSCAASPKHVVDGKMRPAMQGWRPIGMNTSQLKALETATSSQLSIIQGPPGTGKTKVAVNVVSSWLRRGAVPTPILACADSNVAVDNLARGIMQSGLTVVRLGRADSMHSDLHSICVDFAQGGGKAKKRLKKAQVVCCTCTTAGSEALNNTTFACVLIDEAAQVNQLTSMVAITRGCRQLCLVGDHHQLPPTVLCPEAEAAGLSESLFGMLAIAGLQPQLLDTQYRAHPDIAMFPSAAFYEGRIRSGASMAASRPRVAGFAWPHATSPVGFVESTGYEHNVGSSKANDVEAQKVLAILHSIISSGHLAGGVHPRDIGVITPYQAHVTLLEGKLRHRWPSIEIATADGFQGREKELIIVSCVRSNASGSLGHTADWRRTNVMLTRARRGIIVVGNSSTLRYDQNWRSWLDWVQDCGLVQGATKEPSDKIILQPTTQPDPLVRRTGVRGRMEGDRHDQRSTKRRREERGTRETPKRRKENKPKVPLLQPF